MSLSQEWGWEVGGWVEGREMGGGGYGGGIVSGWLAGGTGQKGPRNPPHHVGLPGH